MITMTLVQAAAAMQGEPVSIDKTAEFCGVSTDSRTIGPGMLFVPIAGNRVDGHDYAAQVMEKGAAAMLWQKDHLPVPQGVRAIVVDNTVEAMGALAREWLKMVHPFTVGITGSNGKTSTKDYCASLLATMGKTWKTQGNHNNEIGLPLTIFEMDADTRNLVLEMGMENRGEIDYLVSIAPIDVAIITSIGSAHMENLGSRENIARAKCEILDGLKPQGTFIYNADSPEIRKVLAEKILEPFWFILPYGKDTPYDPVDLKFSRTGLSFRLPALSEKPFKIPSASDVQAMNATAALLMAKAAGIPQGKWHEALESASLTPMRGDLRKWKSSCILDDTYKSNPEAARSAISTLMEIPADVHIAVLSDMLDLGPDTGKLHASIGEFADQAGVDLLYTWGPLSQFTSEAFGKEKKHFDTKEELLEALQPYGEANAAVLVKGSRAMAMDTVVRGLLEGENRMEKVRLGVIFGGQSSEYSVSLHSAASFLRSIHPEKYEVVMIGISLEGGFYRYTGSIDDLEHDHWKEHAAPVAWVHKGIIDLDSQEKISLDCIFPILHGKNGEDGAIQGMMTVLDLPVAGCDILGSAICMDKEVMHRLFDQAGIPAAPYICLHKNQDNPSFEEIEAQMPLPWFVKPCNAGSSYGVHYVDSKEDFDEAVEDAYKYDGRGKVLVEKAIDGFEIGCAVMGDDVLRTGEIDEIEMAGKVFDFAGKYEMKDSAIYCPARISQDKAVRAKELAKEAYRALCCRDMARVDMFIKDDGDIVINEVNTIPGFTSTSRYPTMMAKSGLAFGDLIDALVALAMEKEISL